MIYNVIDRRKHPYRWKKITAIIEPTCQDNSVPDSDQTARTSDFAYDEREIVSLAEAVQWADARPEAITLYLYDLGANSRWSNKLHRQRAAVVAMR